MQTVMVLVGANAGKTVNLGHEGRYKFVRGRLVMSGTPQSHATAIRVLGDYYGAYPQGSEELARAVERYEESLKQQESANGSGEVSPAGSQRDEVLGGVRHDGQGPAAEATTGRGGDAGAGDGQGSSGAANGDGHENAGLSRDAATANGAGLTPDAAPQLVNERLTKAVQALDPENDEHWVADGRPRLSAVEEAAGQTGFTRQDVEAALPGWNRQRAAEAAL